MTTEQENDFFKDIPKEKLTDELREKLKNTQAFAMYKVGIAWGELAKAINNIPADILKQLKKS